jgi:hypothetical protein
MLIILPASALKRLLLPTFGLPMIATFGIAIDSPFRQFPALTKL